MNVLLYISIIPCIFFLIYIYQKDWVDKEPASLILLLLVGGGLSVIPAIALEELADNLLLQYFDLPSYETYLFISAVFGVGLIEEGCKEFFLKLFSWRNKNFNCRYDGLVYAVTVSLGFALAENVMYVLSYGFSTGITRAFTAIPAHTAFGVLMGVFYGRSKMETVVGSGFKAFRYRIKELVIPTIVHGLYDYLLMTDISGALIVWGVILIFIYFVIFAITTKEANNDILFDEGNELYR